MMSVSDIISNLPEDLIGHILSLLHTNFAIRTSVLSKRWRFLWTLVTNVHLNDHHIRLRGDDVTGFDNEVNRVLLLLKAPSIHTFTLFLCVYFDVFQLDKWFYEVARRNVKHFKLTVSSLDPKDLPMSFFNCNSFESVTLWGGVLKFPKFGFVCFPNLKILDLQNVDCGQLPDETFVLFPRIEILRLDNVSSVEDGDFLNKLLQNCPVLEDLVIRRCALSCTTRVCTPLLRSVEIYCSCKDDWKLVIDAPFLQSFTFRIAFGEHKVIINRPDSLITVKYLFEYGSFPMVQPCNAFPLFKAFAAVKYLYLSSCPLVNAIKSSLDVFPLFPNLISLEMAFYFGDLAVLQCFLRNSINLQHLVIEKIENPRWPYVVEECWNEFEYVPECMLCTLTSVEIRGISGPTANEVALIKDILKCGQVLQKLTLKTEFREDEDKKYELLSKIWMVLNASAVSKFNFS